MNFIRHIFYVLIVVASVTACSHSPRVIPKSELENIYAEMLLMDQWIGQDWNNTFVADTSLVYEPILKKHGYSVEDYHASVDYYLNNPEKFSKIFKNINNRFMEKVKELDEKERLQAKIDSMKNIPVHNFDVENFTKILTLPHYDTVKFILDSSGRYIIKLSKLDTIFKGPEMIIANLTDSTKQVVDNLVIMSDYKREK